MAKTDNERPQGIFRYLTPEECDKMVKAKLEHKPKGGNCKGYVGKPWDESELLARRQVLIDLMASGKSRRKIVEEICDRWGISLRVAYDYYNDAIKYLGKDNEEFVRYNRELMQERLENIMQLAIDGHQYKEAVMAATELDKILGLQKSQVEITDVKRVFKFGGDED